MCLVLFHVLFHCVSMPTVHRSPQVSHAFPVSCWFLCKFCKRRCGWLSSWKTMENQWKPEVWWGACVYKMIGGKSLAGDSQSNWSVSFHNILEHSATTVIEQGGTSAVKWCQVFTCVRPSLMRPTCLKWEPVHGHFQCQAWCARPLGLHPMRSASVRKKIYIWSNNYESTWK